MLLDRIRNWNRGKAIGLLLLDSLPGLKATGTRLSVNLQELHGRTTTRLGSMSTTLIVAQVAVAVAILPAAVYLSWHIIKIELNGPTIPVNQFVVANMHLGDEASAAVAAQVRHRLLALMSRLREEPGVAAVTFSSGVPGFGPDRRIEFEGPTGSRQTTSAEVATFHIDVDLLKIYRARLLAGRDFDARDTAARSVIVNHTFATEVLGTTPSGALCAHFRHTGSGTYDIVGVVEDFPGFPRDPGSEKEPTVYHPIAPGDVHPAVVSVRFSGAIPAGISERVRRIGAEIDPALQLRRVVPLSDFNDELRSLWRSVAWVAGFITASVLLLSAAGVHAMMSFVIAQRTREIGIRSALGAQPRQLLLGIFGRAMWQRSIGLVIGTLVSAAIFVSAGMAPGRATGLLFAVAGLMVMVALFAALGPARRGLRIQTVEALRVEG